MLFINHKFDCLCQFIVHENMKHVGCCRISSCIFLEVNQFRHFKNKLLVADIQVFFVNYDLRRHLCSCF